MIDTRAGDLFCVASEGTLGTLIRLVTRWQSKDDVVEFNHSGIILNDMGDTYEALWTTDRGNLSKYKGRLIAIYRPIQTYLGEPITRDEKIRQIFSLMAQHTGKWYPVHRLGTYFFLAPFMKYLTSGEFLMCSELVAKYETKIKSYDGKFGGVTPDDLVDRWRIARTHEKIYKGKLPDV